VYTGCLVPFEVLLVCKKVFGSFQATGKSLPILLETKYCGHEHTIPRGTD
jgi:hypothetical protein